MLTSFAESQRVLDAIDAGAVGYLLKDSDGADVVRAVRAAAAGDSPLDPRAARAVIMRNSRAPEGDPHAARARRVVAARRPGSRTR